MKLFACILIIGLLFTGCSPKLAPGETLFVGSTVKLDNMERGKVSKRTLKKELQGLVRPRPNTKVLGLRLKLWANRIPFLRKKFGEPPVLTSSVNFEKNTQVLENRLQNKGYFHATVSFDTVTRRKKTHVTFTSNVGPQYSIASVSFPADSSELSKAIAATAGRSLLKKGDPYDLDIIKAERVRIDERLKNVGYYYFSPDYLLMNVDSTVGDRKVNIMIRVKPETPGNARQVYRINDIIVHADYSLTHASDTSHVKSDSSLYNGYFIIDPAHTFKPKVFNRTLVIRPGEVYNRDDHNLSLNRLVSLGVYKFVKVQFEQVQTDTANLLNAYYYLTPLPKKSIRLEAGALNKSNNATGSELTLSWRNRNLLRAAELLTVSAFAGVERQISGQQPSVSTNRFGADIHFIVPRITFPFRFNTSSEFVPQTRMNLGYELYNRTDQYSLNSFKLNVGYVWKEHITKEHQLNVFSINYVHPLNITPSFSKELLNNPTLERSIEKQFIIGSNYNYNYNSQVRPNRKTHNIYFNGNIDLSGNLLGLLTGADENDKKTILSVPFAQYVRVEPELRHYFRFRNSKTNMLASRMIIGLGLAYGNSDAMPFAKAFFIGGTNSIRAFRARSLGPGTWYGGNADTSRRFLPDQPGDIKLELNTELRFRITSIINGALFVDAGNIWTVKEDSLRPGSKFSGKFLNQLAVGAGFGLRIDLNLVILRGDLAFPIRKPWLQADPWVLNNIRFNERNWRRENMIFNLAIGYPF
ncbi:MAG TPA: BamA/TamA family outer membrane protein [Chitinophagaceae bacterium]